jgi:hypothetical protein
MTGEVYGNDIVAVPSEMTARQCPHRMVHAGAVDKHHSRLIGLDIPGVGVAVGRLAINLNAH